MSSSRSAALAYTLVSCAFMGAPMNHGRAAIVLPLEKVNSSQTDSNVSYWIFLEPAPYYEGWSQLSFFGEWDADNDADDEVAALSDVFLEGIDSTYAGDIARIWIDSLSAITNCQTWIASTYVSCDFAGEVAVDPSDPNHTRTAAVIELWAQSSMQVEVQAHNTFPTAGLQENSATLHALMRIDTSSAVNGDHGQIGGTPFIELTVKSSWLNAYPLNWEYDQWYVTGSLSQSTSANPTASPLAVGDTYNDDIDLEDWYATEVSNVGDTVTINTLVYTDYDYMWANNDYGPLSGDWQGSIHAEASFYVDVDVP